MFVVLALAVAGCTSPVQPAAPAEFVRYANAVQSSRYDGTQSASTGITHLMPFGKCAIGVGVFANGYRNVGANWTGNADCTSFTLPEHRPASSGDRLPSQGGWDGSGLAATSVVALPDGSLVGASSEVQRLNPDGTVTALADLHLPMRDPKQETGDTGEARSIVRSGDRLVIGGGHVVSDKASPLIWTSDDGGKTVTPAQVPPVNGYVGPMAASGSTIVAVEQTAENDQLGIWRSADGGSSWQLTEFSAGAASPMITNLFRTEHGWLIVGTGGDDRAHAYRPFLASSPDGVTWKVIDTSTAAAGRVIDATVTKSGDLVLVGEGPSSGGTECGVLWTGAADSLRHVDLGCDDSPRATATLADGRVIVVGAKDLWVRA